MLNLMATRISPAQRLAVKQALQFAETRPLTISELKEVVKFLINTYNNKNEEDGKLH